MNKIGKPTIISEDNEYKDFFLLKNRTGGNTIMIHEDKAKELLILKARRNGFTKSHFATVINSIMEQYDFIIIELFPFPKIYSDGNLPINFKTREDANAVVHEYSTALIIDVKKLQSEKEIDDMSANIGW